MEKSQPYITILIEKYFSFFYIILFNISVCLCNYYNYNHLRF